MNAQPTPPPAAAAKPAEPPKNKDFVIKGAERVAGLFTFYRTDDKVFLELQPNQLDKLYDFSMTCESGVGERGIFAAFMMCGEGPISFHKFGKNIQILAKSPMFTAEAGSANTSSA